MNKNPLDSMDRFVPLLDAPEPSFTRLVEYRERRRHRRQLAAGAGGAATLAGFVAAMVWVLPFGTDPTRDPTQIAAAAESDAATASTAEIATAPATTEPAAADPALQPPVYFTACNVGAESMSDARTETVTIPGADGSTVRLGRDRGEIIRQDMTGVSDPRLDGNWWLIFNQDGYNGPRVDANLVTVVLRIENDEGAWQGYDTIVRVPGLASDFGFHLMMTGEGAYEGLTAAMAYQLVESYTDPCSNVRGYILGHGVPDTEGTFPAP